MPNRPRIGITLGDPAGIGPEVVAKALESGRLNRRFDYEVIGNPRAKRRADAADHCHVAGDSSWHFPIQSRYRNLLYPDEC